MASQISPQGYRELWNFKHDNYCLLYSKELLGSDFRALGVESRTDFTCFKLSRQRKKM